MHSVSVPSPIQRQRCQVHFMRNVMVHAPAGQRPMPGVLGGDILPLP